MSVADKNKKDELDQMNETLSRSEQFVEKNQKNLIWALAILVVLVAGVILFRNTYIHPKEKEASEMIYIGEQYFAVDSFQLALHGDGSDYIGFEGIIDDYGMTKTAKLAAAYAGLSYKSMGDYAKAIEYLSKCRASDIMVSPALLGSVGDCYVELKQYDKAAGFFEKASEVNNELLAPIYLMKLARVYEKMDKPDKALKAYEEIKRQYPLSQEGLEVEKYIERIKLSH
jgi:tetratricopeptide (TPR) repeat protein